MITKQLLNRSLALTLLLLCMAFTAVQASSKVDSRARSLEASADKEFIRGNYSRAMETYKSAEQRLLAGQYSQQQNALRLKMARLYIMLQEPENSIDYYYAVYNVDDKQLTINDVCYLTDALRSCGRDQQAEVVLRNYAFKTPYNRDQRFINTLGAVANQQRYYNKGDGDYAVELHSGSSAEADYWVGNWNGQEFYAFSTSRFQDPKKIFFHQTRYASLGDKPLESFRFIPLALQSGPMVYSPDRKMMIATQIAYFKGDRVRGIDDEGGVFTSQLVYSQVAKNSTKWSSARPLFGNRDGSSYAHPVLFNSGESLMFSSNRPGGYGGYDIYMSHWDSKKNRWGDPINLGPIVNTEGDEIYPNVVGDGLYFASNGHEGFGGYDIYRIGFGKNIVLQGSMFHYPYPINSTHNDYGIAFGEKTGYFVSDRRGHRFKDDIYTFDMTITPLGSENAVGVSSEYAAMTGNLNLIKGMVSNQTGTLDKQIAVSAESGSGYDLSAASEGELILSVYFDFNSRALDSESVAALRKMLADPALASIRELAITGYADDFGSASYNKRLSLQRAQSVADYLKENGATPALDVEGRGQITLPVADYIEALSDKKQVSVPMNSEIKDNRINIPMDERIRINRKARRVDIVVKKK